MLDLTVISAEKPPHRTQREFFLWSEVLLRAIADARGCGMLLASKGEAARAQQVAIKWFDDSSDEVGSLNWICEVLDLSRLQ